MLAARIWLSWPPRGRRASLFELTPEQAPASAYQVLARKYRPRNLSALIGQDALVRTLTNAIKSDRVAHAFMLTGVRGVGKTSTARIIARALNCTGRDPAESADPCGTCPACVSIAQERAMDVMEMDAASRTGVEDVRELIEGARYPAAALKYKIYIIDEVHMLSKNAFNALLKTLEEPPPHVKFIFATTEIRKVPITVLSRCQRFDLRRVPAATLATHFANIATAESADVEQDAVAMIARAADGSVRDGLSMLDQAIALSSGTVSAAIVREMLGLADRALIADLLTEALHGRVEGVFDRLGLLEAAGADPLAVMQDLMAFCHAVSRLRLLPDRAQDPATPEIEREQGAALAKVIAIPALTRAWQLLLKGHDEVMRAPRPQQALEMVMIRLVHASTLPTPADLVRQLSETQGAGTPPAPSPRDGGGLGGGSSAGPGAGPRAVAAVVTAPRAAVDVAPAPQAQPSSAVPARATAPLRLVSGDPLPVHAPTPAPDAAVAISEAGRPQTFADIVALFVANREPLLAEQLRSLVHPVAVRPGVLELSLVKGAPPDLTGQIGRALTEWCGTRWQVVKVQASGEPTLAERAAVEEAARWQAALAHPEVLAALEAWPGLEPQAIIPPPEPEPLPPDDAAPPPPDATGGFDPRHDPDEVPLGDDDEWAPFEPTVDERLPSG